MTDQYKIVCICEVARKENMVLKIFYKEKSEKCGMDLWSVAP